MGADRRAATETLVTAVEIARAAGVTRAAVSNWRRRHPDFPEPIGGTNQNPRFLLSEVEAWLVRHGQRSEVSPEVLLWQALRSEYGDDLIRGLADVADMLVTESPHVGGGLRSSVLNLTRQNTAAEVVAGLIDRHLDLARRASADQLSTPQLIRAVHHFAGRVIGTVFDPACGIGSLLLAFRDNSHVTLTGQEIDPSAARLTSARAALAGAASARIEVGDSLRDDRWPQLRAELVVCNPPASVTDWGREDLLLDRRWEFGVPTRAEGELAWLQHSYAHVAPGGRVIIVMPASVAYRKAGRRIRVELVRRGVLNQVVALPAGMAAAHPQVVHLWVLRRPGGADSAVGAVQMVDLTDSGIEGPFEPRPDQWVDVPLIDLLDDEVDLTPARYIGASDADRLAEYAAARQTVLARLDELASLLPPLTAGPGVSDGAIVRVGELAQAGLVRIENGAVTSTSDQLDTDFLRGFVRSAANVRRPTSSSGSYRADVRGSRIPQMSIDDQRRYGTAFRALDEFERHLADVVKLGAQVTEIARQGLAHEVLRPSYPGAN